MTDDVLRYTKQNGQSVSETKYAYFVAKTLKLDFNALKNEIT